MAQSTSDKHCERNTIKCSARLTAMTQGFTCSRHRTIAGQAKQKICMSEYCKYNQHPSPWRFQEACYSHWCKPSARTQSSSRSSRMCSFDSTLPPAVSLSYLRTSSTPAEAAFQGLGVHPGPHAGPSVRYMLADRLLPWYIRLFKPLLLAIALAQASHSLGKPFACGCMQM